MKVCPQCRHICDDTDKKCPVCNFDLDKKIKKMTAEERRIQRRNRNIVFVLVVIAAMVAIFIYALNTKGSNYVLPAWMVERMQYQKVSAQHTPDAPDVKYLRLLRSVG